MRQTRIVFLAVVALSGWLASSIRADNSIEAFFIRSSPAYQDYVKFVEAFGTDEALVIGVCGDLTDTRTRQRSIELAGDLMNLPHVRDVISPAAVIEAAAVDPAAFMRAAADAGFINTDKNLFALVAFFDDDVKRDRKEVYRETARLQKKWERAFGCFHMAGHTILNASLDDSSKEVVIKYFPLLLVFSVSLLWYMLRRPILVIAPLFVTACAEALTLGAITASGAPFSMVMTLIPTMIFIFSVASSVHILVHFLDLMKQGGGVRDVIRRTYGDKLGAVFYSLLTTAIGFLSLSVSSIEPIRNLGLFTAVGCGMSFISVWLVLPPFLSLVAGGRVVDGHRGFPMMENALERIVRAAMRLRYPLLAACLLLGVASIVSMRALPVQTNAVDYFQETSRVRSDIQWLEKNLMGISQVNLLIKEGASEERRKTFLDTLRGSPLVVSILTKETVEPFVSRPMTAGGRERIILQCVTGGVESLTALRSDIDTAAKAARIGPVGVTGLYPLILDSQKEMIRTLMTSLMMAAGVIGAVLLVIAGSVPLALAAGVPNLTTVFAVFLYMKLFDIPVDITTVTVASVALGIAVDDTVHLMLTYKKMRRGTAFEPAMLATLRMVGVPLIMTSVVIGAGFATFIMSDFYPIRNFGILMSVTIATALALDLLVTPAMLRLVCGAGARRDAA